MSTEDIVIGVATIFREEQAKIVARLQALNTGSDKFTSTEEEAAREILNRQTDRR